MKTTNDNKSTAKPAAAKTTTAKKGAVKAKSSAAEGLRELFTESLKDIYWAEKALTKALPKMAKNATTESLIAAIEDHLEVTKKQVTRLEQVLFFTNVTIFTIKNPKAVSFITIRLSRSIGNWTLKNC